MTKACKWAIQKAYFQASAVFSLYALPSRAHNSYML